MNNRTQVAKKRFNRLGRIDRIDKISKWIKRRFFSGSERFIQNEKLRIVIYGRQIFMKAKSVTTDAQEQLFFLIKVTLILAFPIANAGWYYLALLQQEQLTIQISRAVG